MKESFSFTRYLSAKKSVDDRALNRRVWETLQRETSVRQGRSFSVLEVGAGIGTMIERVLAWDLLEHGVYTAIDAQPENIRSAQERLPEWAHRSGYQVIEHEPTVFTIEKPGQHLEVHLQSADLFDILYNAGNKARWDLLIANAFLDLVDLSTVLPQILGLLKPGALFYFTINFDGVTVFEPAADPGLESQILASYHRTMNERVVNARPSGDSQTGHHLFQQLTSSGARILAAGASDWVVFAQEGKYPGDEAYFLHCIISMIQDALQKAPALDPQHLQGWCDLRHNQIDRGELVYIAHQLDFTGVTALSPTRIS